MNRPKLLRALRIAWTVAWGVVSVSLIVLWVRSYSKFDGIHKQLANGTYLTAASTNGVVFLREEERNSRNPPVPTGWIFRSQTVVIGNPNFQLVNDPGFTLVQSPHLALILVTAAAAVTPCIRYCWRFSLRTLLVATTLIAVVLGLVVYLNRAPSVPPINVGDFER